MTANTEIQKECTAVCECSCSYNSKLKNDVSEKKGKYIFENKKVLFTVISGLLLFTGIIFNYFNSDFNILFFGLAVMSGIYFPLKTGIYSLKNSFTFDINVLLIIAVIGAIALGEWIEAATVLFLFLLGGTLESFTLDKTRQSIRGLIGLAPKKAKIKDASGDRVVLVEDINLGDVVIIKPGERVPIDGIIIYGSTSINQSPITGESMPVKKNIGEQVFSGTLNKQGYIEVRASKLVKDTTLSKIIKMVEEAQEQKAPSQRVVDIFANYYTPAVIVTAVLITVIPTVFFRLPFNEWFYRALILLVVSCPCAFVISTPVAIVSAVGSASKKGVLIKGGAYLEQAGNLKTVAFDKTGTLTKGKPVVTDIIAVDLEDEPEILKLAASMEKKSEHHLAEAVVNKAEEQKIELLNIDKFTSLTGKGVKAEIGQNNYYAASSNFFNYDLKIKDKKFSEKAEKLQNEGKSVVVIGTDEKVLGIIAVMDDIRESSKNVIKSLNKLGLKNIMLSGDNEKTAKFIAGKLGINDYKAELLPEDKLAVIKEYQSKHGKTAMVGDGINDAPALAASDIGIAMGGAGTDTAFETADIILMADGLDKLPYTINLSRKTLQIIKQNITFAVVVKLAAVVLVFPGILNLWLAIMADTGAALAVILNSMRLLKN